MGWSIGKWIGGLLGRRPDDSGPPAFPPGPPSATIDDVIARMRAVDARLPHDDGVAWFNRMYLAITEEVKAAVSVSDFQDPLFLSRLDVIFANLYFAAVEHYEQSPESAPRSWAPLLQSRASRRIAPLQFALAGMNAHINHDLVIAIVDTCGELEREPERGTPSHRDFQYVNELLTRAQEKVEPMFKRGPLSFLDKMLGRADEAAEMWSMTHAREAAWSQAEVLWTLRDRATLAENYLLTLDRTVGFAGRGLLVERVF
jgi:hypothetical protein